MATIASPAVLVVHGAYCTPSLLESFLQDVAAAGFVVRCPRLPTCGDVRPPVAGLSEDIRVVQATATELKAAGHPIIVLAHSYGGLVATEAITSELYAAAPRSTRSAGVLRLIYVSAHLALPGMSIRDIYTKHGFLCDVELQFNDDGTASVTNPIDAFYNDLELKEAERASAQNVTHNIALVGDIKAERAPWRAIPTTFVYCLKDLSMKMPLAQGLVKDALDLDESCGMKTVSIDAGHFPFLSKPAAVVSMIENVWSDRD